MTPLLQIQNVSKTYPGPSGPVKAIRNINLEVGAGEFVAVQGPSGCGKTTLLLAAGGLLEPGSGNVAVSGQDLYSLPVSARARFRAVHIGFVFQQFHLIQYLNVLENVLTPMLGWVRNGAEERGRELILQFGLQERAHHRPSELSTGERQRVALARALLNSPRLLLADEPTGNLDKDNAAIVLACLSRFAQEGGAVLLVTHDAVSAQASHRQVRLAGGEMLSHLK